MRKIEPPQVTLVKQPFPFELRLPQRGLGPYPTIVITPLLGRLILFPDLHFERMFADYFTKNGFATVLVDRPIFDFNPSEGLEQFQDYLQSSIHKNSKILDSLETRSEIDVTRIGTLGISFGSFVNLLGAAKDKRIKAHVFALSGGNIPEIMMKCTDPLMKSFVRAALNATKVSPEDFQAQLQNVFTEDPLMLQGKIERDKILLVLALFDRVIPFFNGKQLRRVLGNPKTMYLPFGHYASVLLIPLLRFVALRFFQEKL